MKARGESLSQAEIETLLASLPMEEGGEAAASLRPMPSRQVRTWDFRRPDKFSKDHMRSLLALHQNFARIASSALTARLRTTVTIRVTSVDQGLYEEYIELLPTQSLVNVTSLKPLEGNIIVEFQPELAMVMLDRLLGGHGGVIDTPREMTDIELALVRNLVRTLLSSMREAWTNLAEIDPVVEETSANPQLVQVAAASDIVVIVLLEVQVGNRLGTVSLCIPHLVLEPLMQRLSAQVWVVSNRRQAVSPEVRAQIVDNLRHAKVKLSAVLGETLVTLDELRRLQEGDVLMLGPGAVEAVALDVVDQRTFTGRPGILGGRMAVQITEVERGLSHDG
jgi:flagellar motor switch protein FliM